MKILIIGSGGREHALAWKIAQSQVVSEVFVAPGNAGSCDSSRCVDIQVADTEGLIQFVKDNHVDLTVVGPEAPLVAGVVDAFEKEGLKIFGPNALAARLEASKVFAKQIMQKAGVPTADCGIFDDPQQAKEYVAQKGAPVVVKADGLAQGKGVIVATTEQEAIDAIHSIMEKKVFGKAGNQIIIEECLRGEEASLLVLCDGEHCLPLASSQDHKRIFDNDEGPNTGGMGAYSPAPIVSDKLMKEVLSTVVKPVMREMEKIGCPYKGVLYVGLMITSQGPKVLEFNVRFGDPETQAVLPRLKSDLVKALFAVVDGTLDKIKLSWARESCVCVVAASGGYPGAYQKGKEITGLDSLENKEGVVVFHAGTTLQDNKIVTNGGRVLGVCALSRDIKSAIEATYGAIGKISFDGMHFRRDIGVKALKEEA